MHPTLRRGLSLVNRLLTGRGSPDQSAARARPRRRVAPELDALEGRQLLFFGVKATVTPAPIWPPNNQFVPVTIKGTFIEFAIVGNKQVVKTLPGPKKANFQVIDEYRQDEPFGPITLNSKGDGTYDFSVTTHLQARRSTQFPAGRRYYIIVAARDDDGWGGKILHVQVPISLQDRGQGPIPFRKPNKAASHQPGRH